MSRVRVQVSGPSVTSPAAIQPRRVEKFKLPTDPTFDEQARDIVVLYLDPPERALVLCMDDEGQIQTLDCTAPFSSCIPAADPQTAAMVS